MSESALQFGDAGSPMIGITVLSFGVASGGIDLGVFSSALSLLFPLGVLLRVSFGGVLRSSIGRVMVDFS